MGIHNRPYMQDSDSAGGGGLAVGMPRPTQAVRYLLIVNFAVFVLQLLFDRPTGRYVFGAMSHYLGVTVGGSWQVWRYVTFQFLHSTQNLFHIALNMLGLYMLGTPLEQHLGTRRFLRFYLGCGAVAGLAYAAAGTMLRLPGDVPIIGASGGVYAILLACAVLFPHFRLVLVFFLVPIRLAAVIVFGAMILMMLGSIGPTVVGDASFWSDVAHLGGAVAAAVWIWVLPAARGAGGQVSTRLRRGAWQRKMRRRAAIGAEVDRILQKIHDRGIQSLSRSEKKALQQASDLERQEDRDARRG